MTTTPTVIVGAGLAGLIAAHAWPGTPVLEAAPNPAASHRALLRFRSDAVARLTGIEFKQVRVRKGIWTDDEGFCQPRIDLANMYSMKCNGRFLPDRSIWNLDPVDRFIAPDDFYDQLVANVGARVRWGEKVDYPAMRGIGHVVSTAPLPEVLKQLQYVHGLAFARQPITVYRFHLPDADLYQTVYFPGPETSMYRASITGHTLIVEFAGGPPNDTDDWEDCVCCAFGLGEPQDVLSAKMEEVLQRFGKIAPVDDAIRRRLLFQLSHDHHIFSLGRFATWRNLLLDDVVGDIDVIKRLIRNDSSYDMSRVSIFPTAAIPA